MNVVTVFSRQPAWSRSTGGAVSPRADGLARARARVDQIEATRPPVEGPVVPRAARLIGLSGRVLRFRPGEKSPLGHPIRAVRADGSLVYETHRRRERMTFGSVVRVKSDERSW